MIIKKQKKEAEKRSRIINKIDMDNGNFPYAKDIGRTLAKTTLTGSHRAIIDCILDKTYGWYDPKSEKVQKLKKRKIKEQITYRNFEDFTGIKRNNISKYIKELIDWKVIKRQEKGQYHIYSFNINVNQWDKGLFRESVIRIDDTLKCHKGIRQSVIRVYDTLSSGYMTLEDSKTGQKANIGNGLPVDENTPKETIKRNYIKKEEKEDIYIDKKLREEREIFDYWNSLDIFKHKTFKSFEYNIKEALKNYSLEEIKDTIKNYSLILRGEEYIYTCGHTLTAFLKPENFDKFKDLKKAKKNFLIRRVNNNPETEAVEYERYKPEPGKKETKEERKARLKKFAERMADLKKELKEGD